MVQGAAVAGLAEAVEVMRGRSATVDENYECGSWYTGLLKSNCAKYTSCCFAVQCYKQQSSLQQ